MPFHGTLWDKAKDSLKDITQSTSAGVSTLKDKVSSSSDIDMEPLMSIQISPTETGLEYLEEQQQNGTIQNENHWYAQLMKEQTVAAYINRMVITPGYTGSRKNLLQNVNTMLEDGYITKDNLDQSSEEGSLLF